ncbi:hypothetical protein [Filimonas effusa]|uniref:Uncharacterized protein n=1 Tax=Filimonas effusa TaxID=2508721 RepID=A0A4V1MAS4_9BACT|nr:hypothetical protein [Filimonas effusa]RXK86886.1 hypothetical protein ESB13_08880 [Filimonas effusa]
MSTSNPTAIISYKQNLFASGLVNPNALEPLVALFPEPQMEKQYRLLIHVYIPDGVEPSLNKDFGNITEIATEAGNVSARLIAIDYDEPSAEVDTYSLWALDITYAINDGVEAQTTLAQFVIGDPQTSRGTVTGVVRT